MVRDVSGQAQLSPNRVTRSQTRAQSTTNNHDATNMEGESFMMEPGASETYLLDSNSSFIADMLSTSTMFGASMTSPPSPKRGNRRRTPSPTKQKPLKFMFNRANVTITPDAPPSAASSQIVEIISQEDDEEIEETAPEPHQRTNQTSSSKLEGAESMVSVHPATSTTLPKSKLIFPSAGNRRVSTNAFKAPDPIFAVPQVPAIRESVVASAIPQSSASEIDSSNDANEKAAQLPPKPKLPTFSAGRVRVSRHPSTSNLPLEPGYLPLAEEAPPIPQAQEAESTDLSSSVPEDYCGAAREAEASSGIEPTPIPLPATKAKAKPPQTSGRMQVSRVPSREVTPTTSLSNSQSEATPFVELPQESLRNEKPLETPPATMPETIEVSQPTSHRPTQVRRQPSKTLIGEAVVSTRKVRGMPAKKVSTGKAKAPSSAGNSAPTSASVSLNSGSLTNNAPAQPPPNVSQAHIAPAPDPEPEAIPAPAPAAPEEPDVIVEMPTAPLLQESARSSSSDEVEVVPPPRVAAHVPKPMRVVSLSKRSRIDLADENTKPGDKPAAPEDLKASKRQKTEPVLKAKPQRPVGQGHPSSGPKARSPRRPNSKTTAPVPKRNYTAPTAAVSARVPLAERVQQRSASASKAIEKPVRPTSAHAFTFESDRRLDLKKEKARLQEKPTTNAKLMSFKPAHHPVTLHNPTAASLARALEALEIAHRPGSKPSKASTLTTKFAKPALTVPQAPKFATDERLKDRHAFDEKLRLKDEQRRTLEEAERLEREKLDAEEVRRLRRLMEANARANVHELPAWYKDRRPSPQEEVGAQGEFAS